MIKTFTNTTNTLDYKKKSLKKFSCSESYEEIDARLASGWYVDSIGNSEKKEYKTKKISYTILKKSKKWAHNYKFI